MFAKLKKKIEEEQQNAERSPGLSSVTASPSSSLSNFSGSETTSPAKTSSSRSLQESPQKREPTEPDVSISNVSSALSQTKQDISNSQDSEKSRNLSETSLKVLQQKSEHIQMLETKIKDLTQQVTVEHKRCLLLQVELQQSTQGHERRERELLARIEGLYKAKSESDQRLQESRSKVERLIEQQDSKEELEGFQAQELAKVKHLLLASQQELQSCKETLKLHSEEILRSQTASNQLDEGCQRLREELAQSQAQLALQANLQQEIDRLKQEALKSSSVLEEKDSNLIHLQERLELLENRLKDGELSGDERHEALLLERQMLEKKLDESHQHLSEVKTTWSDKIHSLETQIFHLNKKMAEDSEDCTRLEGQVETLRLEVKTLEEENWRLAEDLQEVTRNLDKIEKAKSNIESGLHQKLQEKQSEMELRTCQLEEQLAIVTREQTREKQESQQIINELVSSQTEHVEKAIEVERQMTKLEDDNRRLKTELTKREKELATLVQEAGCTKEMLDLAEAKLNRLDAECSQSAIDIQGCTRQLKQKEQHLQTIAEERDRLMLRNAELSQQLELVRRELEEETLAKDKDTQELQLKKEKLFQDLCQSSLRISELEKRAIDQNNSSHRLSEQNSKIIRLEDEVADKNKTIKLQQQRLNDMKKTFKRELRSQTLPSCDTSGGEETYPMNNTKVNNDHKCLEDINFRYLRHVVFKFMTSPEYEAQHLIRAVTVLLHFTQEEEKYIRDTLDWKTSWFGSKPQPANDLKAPALLSVPR